MREDLDELMLNEKIDALLIVGGLMHNPAMTYFTGIANGLNMTLIKPQGKEPTLFANVLEAAEAETTGIKTICTNTFPRNEALEKSGGDLQKTRALELQWMFEQAGVAPDARVSVYGQVELHRALAEMDNLRALMPEMKLLAGSAVDVIQQAKLTKGPQELERIRGVGRKVVEIVKEVRQTLARSKAENGILRKADGSELLIGDMHRLILRLVAEHGLECPEGFIFANGADAGYPHSSGNPAAPIRQGETIVFDFYPCERGGGYFYDFTRTWCPGFAPEEIRKDYDTVKHVYYASIDGITSGTPFAHYQKQACDMFESQGHPTLQSDPQTRNGYCHSLGHGIGMQVHELPISRLKPEPYDELKPGLVFTIEPGLYYPEKNYGIRIENTFHINAAGELEECVPYSDDLVIEME